MEVTLKQLVGRYRGPGGGILEKLWDVDQVFADGHLVGVVFHRDHAAFQPRAGIDPTTADVIAAQIDEIREREGRFAPANSPAIRVPPNPVEELQQMVADVTENDDSEQEGVGDDWTE